MTKEKILYNINVNNFIEILQETLVYAEELKELGFGESEKEELNHLMKIML